jgi:hypothetical protein
LQRPQNQQRDYEQPQRNDHRRSDIANGPLGNQCRTRAPLRQHRRINQAHGTSHRQRQQDEFIKRANNRDGIGNKVNWRQRIGSDDARQRLSVPRNARIARGQVKRDRITPERLRPALQCVQPARHCAADHDPTKSPGGCR